MGGRKLTISGIVNNGIAFSMWGPSQLFEARDEEGDSLEKAEDFVYGLRGLGLAQKFNEL